jgi:hypothetical protein
MLPSLELARDRLGCLGLRFAGGREGRSPATGAVSARPLWASTGTKDPAYSDVLYVEELIAPHIAMPPGTRCHFEGCPACHEVLASRRDFVAIRSS